MTTNKYSDLWPQNFKVITVGYPINGQLILGPHFRNKIVFVDAPWSDVHHVTARSHIRESLEEGGGGATKMMMHDYGGGRGLRAMIT